MKTPSHWRQGVNQTISSPRCAFHDPENAGDAVTAVAAAIQAHGVPQEFLRDNGVSFNQFRRGSITPLERFLADRGCLAISGKIRSPIAQGKNEPSRQTRQRFLDAHSPATLERVREPISEYRNYYNHWRHHQGLSGEITPGQAWDVVEHHPAGGEPLALISSRVRWRIVIGLRRRPRPQPLSWRQGRSARATGSPRPSAHRLRPAKPTL